MKAENPNYEGPQQSPKTISPWAEFAEERRASARKYNDLCNQLRLAFRAAQKEAYGSWCAWEEEVEEQGEEVTAQEVNR